MSEVQFLADCGWGDASKVSLAGDASGRKYTRLIGSGHSAILMDHGPGSTEQLTRFADVARHLLSLGLSAPEILADGSDQFLLLEDLGDAVFARVIEQKPELETMLYKAAIDALIVSQRAPIPSYIAPYHAPEMAKAIELAFDWYPTPQTCLPKADFHRISDLFRDLMEEHLQQKPVLIQRDFHAENLIWLPHRTGAARVGLLDFQDAVYGDPAYDVASLLMDARRDVSPELRDEVTAYFAKETGADLNAVSRAISLCSAQRNLRILGIFSALVIRDGKRSYADLIPRVWRNLQSDLAHPALTELRDALAILPQPDDEVLAQIRSAHV